MKARFSVTYEIVTQESAEEGEADERGYVCEEETLRDALKELHRTRTNECDSGDGTHAEVCGTGRVRWVTQSNGMEYRTGAYESRSLHIPETVTAASARRIARLAGATLRS